MPKDIVIGPGEVHFRVESEKRKPPHKQPAQDRIRVELVKEFPPYGRVPDHHTEGDLASLQRRLNVSLRSILRAARDLGWRKV